MKISIATWSFQKLLRDPQKPVDYLSVPDLVRQHYGQDVEALELNNVFFASRDSAYLSKLLAASRQVGLALLNIAVDEPGDLSGSDASQRIAGVQKYADWLPIAAEMGIKAIRANTGGADVADLPVSDPRRSAAEQACIDSLRRLCDEGRRRGVCVLVENHWGLSGNPQSLVRVIQAVQQSHGTDAIGTLVDWGNWPPQVDRWQALEQTYPYAKAVHAKIQDIDENLNHPAYDLARCIEVTRSAGYDGYLGIEYEGKGEPLAGVGRGVARLKQLLS